MNDAIAKQYDTLYAADGYVFGAKGPLRAVTSVPKLVAGGRALDIGGGEGRNALYLAEHGFLVTVVDLSRVGIEKLQRAAADKQERITTQVADITEVELVEQYDAVVMTLVLHHLDTADAVEVIKRAQVHTNLAGVHVIVTFMDKGDLFERSKATQRFYPNESHLKELYKDWDIVNMKSKETTTLARDKTGEPLKNHLLILVARKQSAAASTQNISELNEPRPA